ncbi:hypothetical protein MMC17_002897 [Xylographa soralifera]|nr:hypothetical protein [Xylographa soralifera]
MAIADPPTPLSFPPLTYAKLSPAPFLHAHLTSTPPLRPNTRTPSTFRPLSAHTGSLTHTHGSAVVRTGDTAVVCGVRAEVLRVDDIADYRPPPTEGDNNNNDATTSLATLRHETHTSASLNLLVPNIELQTGCSPAHLPGGPPSPLAQSLAHRLLSLLHIAHLVPLPQLQIWHTPPDAPSTTTAEHDDDPPPRPQLKAFWVLYIDVLFLSLDGGAFDGAWAAVLAALHATALPRAWWDAEREGVVCSPRVAEATPLALRGWPVVGTFGVFESGGGGPWVLADPDDFEEGLCEESVTVVVDGEGGRVLRVEKGGGGGVGVKEMRACVEMVRGRVGEWREVLGRGA